MSSATQQHAHLLIAGRYTPNPNRPADQDLFIDIAVPSSYKSQTAIQGYIDKKREEQAYLVNFAPGSSFVSQLSLAWYRRGEIFGAQQWDVDPASANKSLTSIDAYLCGCHCASVIGFDAKRLLRVLACQFAANDLPPSEHSREILLDAGERRIDIFEHLTRADDRKVYSLPTFLSMMLGREIVQDPRASELDHEMSILTELVHKLGY